MNKPYKYKKASVVFSKTNDADVFNVEWTFTRTTDGKKEVIVYKRTRHQMEEFYVPIIMEKKKIIHAGKMFAKVSTQTSFDYCKGALVRVIEDGNDFWTFKGISVDKNGNWKVR